jgi:hypothetical protein
MSIVQLAGLSERVEEAAKFPYVTVPSPDDLAKLRKGFSDLQVDSKGETETASSSLPYFTAPEGYTGPVRETKKTVRLSRYASLLLPPSHLRCI